MTGLTEIFTAKVAMQDASDLKELVSLLCSFTIYSNLCAKF